MHAKMRYAETVVNVPIRSSFSRRHESPPPPEPMDESGYEPDTSFEPLRIEQDNKRAKSVAPKTSRGLQTFHYHIPVELEETLQPGHLVWVPFGHQEVQGIVVQLSANAPVETKPITRLARPEPVLTQMQLELAAWISEYYVAAFVEAVKLFIPPGLLTRKDKIGQKPAARAKREVQIELLADSHKVGLTLPKLGRNTQQTKVLGWLIEQQGIDSGREYSATEIKHYCELKSLSTLTTLEKQQIIALVNDGVTRTKGGKVVRLLPPLKEARNLLQTLRGTDKFEPVLDVLLQQNRPLWKSELYALVDTDLKTLRTLQKAGLIQLTEKPRFRDPLAGRIYEQTYAPTMTGDQAAAWETMERLAYPKNGPRQSSRFLLHGVTGSGKTEIFLRAIAETLEQGKQAIVLVPEIALTPQTVARFAGRFPDRVTVVHSQLSAGERYDVWRRVRDGEYDVVVGPRSALFTPMPNLGLIVIDEEHESSYKQNAEAWGSFTVFYDTRAVAQRLADLTGSVIILGSATPSIDSYFKAKGNKAEEKAEAEGLPEYTLLEMNRRVMGHGRKAEKQAEAEGLVESRVGSVDQGLAEGQENQEKEQEEEKEYEEKRHTVAVRDNEKNDDGGQAHSSVNRAEEGAAEVEFAGTDGVEDPPAFAEANERLAPAIYGEMPPVELVDMRQELRAGNRSIFSRLLQSELHATLDKGEQAILFLNRRGTRTFVICRDCGDVQKCTNCDVPFTFHERADVLVCHHCNQRVPIPTVCPACDSKRIKYFGSGTQRIEELVSQIAPRARVVRWDADTTKGKGSHERILSTFMNREADVLVGTQMIAKGLDLPMVTLVGVIAADTGLYLPDFRSGERTFQLLTQVAGRAGRSDLGGRVVIQTYTPGHYAIQAAAQHDYEAFYRHEIAFRAEHGYPPFQRLLRLVYWDKKLEKAEKAATEMAAMLRYRLTEMGVAGSLTNVMGPAPAFFSRFRGYYRWQVLVRAPDPTAVLDGLPIPFGWRVDVDPVTML